MSLEVVKVHRVVCDVCGEVGPYGSFHFMNGWEQDVYNGHEIDSCPRHRYGYSGKDKEMLALRYPDPA